MTDVVQLHDDGMLDLDTRRVVLTATGLTLRNLDVSPSMAEVAEIGRRLGVAREALAWWIGDWFLLAEKTYGATYVDAEEITGLSYATLATIAWTCREVESSRRRELLPFAHHREVAALAPWAQTQWLELAEREGLSRNALRARIRADRELPAPTPVTSLRFIVAPDRVERWQLAAERAGSTLDEWAADVLDEAAA